MDIQGGCLCGGVRYRLTAPITEIALCHCSVCRKAQGGAFATNAPVRLEQIEWLSGTSLFKSFRASPPKERVFCSECGSPLFSRHDGRPGVIRLRLGTLDQPVEPAGPIYHIHYASRVSWYRAVDDYPKHEREFVSAVAQGDAPGASPQG